ncbi:glycosyltransferase [Vibrio astriarenae]|uniref:Glycosyltransferase n=1 Tax=Vibrio astriarenae TaxID=1481923 RepID=A0A7Z2T5C1_9VIBR|nr:glycosyltransferase family 2 protein [Vibrio astriarenae]QIA64448.1 glycosyltransferase [Vibrio astriarenae]
MLYLLRRALFKARAKLNPQLLVDAKAYHLIGESGLFDQDYYAKVVGSIAPYKDLLSHFVAVGHRKQFSPSPFFSTEYYLSQNEDIRQAGVNALAHYIEYGEAEGRSPNPFFNPKEYLELNPDLAAFDKSLLFHYLQLGRAEGRRVSASDIVESSLSPYQAWISQNETETYAEIHQGLASFSHNPLISIVVPVYNPDEQHLIDCIESVRNQSYPHWELCLADDKSTQEHVKPLLEHYAQLDSRIKVVFREQNGHISAASNSALEEATGEWTALLDHDDELHQHALYYVAKALHEQPDSEFVYSDEDKIDQQGKRSDPHFKSSWNLDLLYSQNYVSHLGVYKTQILKQIGGFRIGFEGSQDFDLLLRYSREIDQSKVVHIPRVLYHWRMVEGSTALGAGEKSYTTEAGIKALQDHFQALDKPVHVEKGKHDNIYKVSWLMQEPPLVSLIMPTYNGYAITKQAIDSIIEKSDYRNFEILLVDNNSDDPQALAYFDEIDKHEQVRVLRYPHPFNFSAINNFAAKHAKGEVLGFINNDIEVINPEWLTEMVSQAVREDVGCVGAMLYYPNDTIQHAGVITGIGGVAGHSHKYFKRGEHGYFSRLHLVQNLSAVTAACLLVRKSIFEQVDGLNEQHLAIAFNDVDFCLKVQAAGYRNLWTPYAELYHHESITRGAEDNPEKVERFNKEMNYMKNTWKTHLNVDPCYSRNLSTTREDFSLEM